MFCTQCGSLNPETVRFCSSCGAVLQPESAPTNDDATVVAVRQPDPVVEAPSPAVSKALVPPESLDATVVAVRKPEAPPLPPSPYNAPVYADASSAGGESATVASIPSVPAVEVPAAPPAPVFNMPAPPPTYPTPTAYPLPGASPNGVIPPVAYQQPITKPPTARSTAASGWLARLPVIGGLLTVIGFVLNWFGTAGSSGIDRVSEGANALGYVLSNGLDGIPGDELFFYMILPLLTVLALIAGIFGLLSFLARKGLRLPTTILAVLGLIVVVAYMLVGAYTTGVDLGTVASAWSVGYYLLLAGLLWMAITPWFGKAK